MKTDYTFTVPDTSALSVDGSLARILRDLRLGLTYTSTRMARPRISWIQVEWRRLAGVVCHRLVGGGLPPIDWNWWSTFTKTAINPIPELGEGGCGNAFLTAFSEGGIVSAINENLDGGPDPWEVVDEIGGAVGLQYVVSNGLVCPGCSSIYRGIGSATETVAGWTFVLDVYTRIGEGAVAEVTAYRKRQCQ